MVWNPIQAALSSECVCLTDESESFDRWVNPGLQLDESFLKVVSMPQMRQIDIRQYDRHTLTYDSETILRDAEVASNERLERCKIVGACL